MKAAFFLLFALQICCVVLVGWVLLVKLVLVQYKELGVLLSPPANWGCFAGPRDSRLERHFGTCPLPLWDTMKGLERVLAKRDAAAAMKGEI